MIEAQAVVEFKTGMTFHSSCRYALSIHSVLPPLSDDRDRHIVSGIPGVVGEDLEVVTLFE